MAKLKINNSDNVESIEITLCPSKHKVAYQSRVDSLVNSGLLRDDAEKVALVPIEMELYYDEDNGLFLVETDAVGSTDIFNPYTKELLENDEN